MNKIHKDIPTEAVAALLERYQLGQLHKVERLPSAEGDPMLLVNGELMMRFSQSDAQSSVLAKEALIYRRLRLITDVACPDVLAFDTQHDLVPFDVLVQTHVQGQSGNAVWSKLDTLARELLSEELGRMCAAMHNIPWSVYGDLVPDGLNFIQSARWTDVVLRDLEVMYNYVAEHSLLPQRLLDGLLTTVNDGDAIFDAAEAPVLTHAALGWSNILLQQNGSQWHLVGIVDWKQARLADAAWEFASLWHDPEALYPLPDAFMYGYKERRALPKELRIRQRFYRLLDHFRMLSVCHQQFASEPAHAQGHVTAIERLLRL